MRDGAPIIRDRHRLGAVRRLVVLDTPPTEAFDRLTRMAASLLGCPVSLLTIIDAERQWFKSTWGLPEPFADVRETALSHSLCQYVVAAGERVVITDASQDADVCDHPAVQELGMRSYAGAPIWSPDGHPVGALCVADFAPHRWPDRELDLLEDLAQITTRELALNVHERMDARRRVFGGATGSWS
jgi:GAF domain-containing protein